MEPVSIAVVCTVVFGAVTALSVFVRQLLLSHDKPLNEKAQLRALTHETKQLEKLRLEMENNRRFDSHYQVLGENRDAIQYIDQKIEDILSKKIELIQRYASLANKESSAMITDGTSVDRKEICDLLRKEIDDEIKFYDNELKELQARRATIWDARSDLQDYLLNQEKIRNQNLDKLYEGHTGLLEKIYLSHNQTQDQSTKRFIDAGSNSFRDAFSAPIQFLMQCFKPIKSLSKDAFSKEKQSRENVLKFERELNGDSLDNMGLYPNGALFPDYAPSLNF